MQKRTLDGYFNDKSKVLYIYFTKPVCTMIIESPGSTPMC